MFLLLLKQLLILNWANVNKSFIFNVIEKNVF